MGRRSRPKRHAMVKNTRFVDDNHAPALRTALVDALPAAPAEVRERLARTALLSKREAIRYLEASASDEALAPEHVEAARAVIDRLAAA